MRSRTLVQALVQCAVFSGSAVLGACGGGEPEIAPALPAASHTLRSTVSAGTGSVPNWNGAYMFTDDDSSAYAELAQTATANTRVTWPIYHRDAAIESSVTPADTVYIGASLGDVTSGAQQKPPYVFYDPEHWSATPLTEQQNPAAAIAKAAQIVHAAGKKFGVTPDGEFMGVYRCTFVMSKSIIQSVDWTQVDELNIQAQHLASDNTCTKVGSSSFQYMVTQIAAYVKSQNPNIAIVAQVSMRDSSPARILAAAGSVYGIAEAIHVSYPAGSTQGCNYCSPADLATVLHGL